MEKDFDQWISLFQELFEGRRDCYGAQPGKAEKQPLTHDVLLGHLHGRRRIGVYPVMEDTCKFAAIDFDRDDFQDALAIVKRLSSYGLPAYVERSKSKGYHIWLFFSDWTEARKVRTVLKATLEELALEAEIFPKQDSTKNGGFGNYIYLPFFNLNNNGGRTIFIDEEGKPYPEQIKVLSQIQRINPASLDKILQAKMGIKSNNPPAPLPSTPVSYVNDKRLLVFESEFASVLRIVGREGNTLSPTIRQAWESGNLQILTKNSPARATEAHISIIGHITRDELRRYLDRTEIGNGFANRFLWLCVKRSKCLPEGGRNSDGRL